MPAGEVLIICLAFILDKKICAVGLHVSHQQYYHL
jgi:hypothetical protein